MVIYFLDPSRNAVECFPIGTIVNDDNTSCTLIVTLSNFSESFLTSSIPELQPNSFAVESESLSLEVDTCDKNRLWQLFDQILTYCGHVIPGEFAVNIPQKQARFANSGVTDNNNFEEMIVSRSTHECEFK